VELQPPSFTLREPKVGNSSDQLDKKNPRIANENERPQNPALPRAFLAKNRQLTKGSNQRLVDLKDLRQAVARWSLYGGRGGRPGRHKLYPRTLPLTTVHVHSQESRPREPGLGEHDAARWRPQSHGQANRMVSFVHQQVVGKKRYLSLLKTRLGSGMSDGDRPKLPTHDGALGTTASLVAVHSVLCTLYRIP
jgi:hypothetical protein